MDFEAILSNLSSLSYIKNFSFSRHTTAGIGGKAPIAFFPKNEGELLLLLKALRLNAVPYVFLGKGANVLVSDNGFNGAVVCTEGMKRIIRVGENKLYAECGATAEQVVRFALDKALGGIEFLAGIPATVGGLVFMNAGADNIYIDSVLQSVRVLRDDNYIDIPAFKCDFSYKKSIFQTNGDCIVGCTFQLKAGNITEISGKIRSRRFARSKLPKGKSMGCVFLNPQGFSAGELIDKAGWKGVEYGNALVSPDHANFIINTGGASSSEVRQLIEMIRYDVFQKSGIMLQEEIRYIGE